MYKLIKAQNRLHALINNNKHTANQNNIKASLDSEKALKCLERAFLLNYRLSWEDWEERSYRK